MKPAVKAAIVCIVTAFALPYAMVAFIQWHVNPGLWSEGGACGRNDIHRAFSFVRVHAFPGYGPYRSHLVWRRQMKPLPERIRITRADWTEQRGGYKVQLGTDDETIGYAYTPGNNHARAMAIAERICEGWNK